MRIVYHLGAHFTDEERLLKCLLANRDALADHSIAVPPTRRFRALLRDTAIRLKGDAATIEEQALILEEIMAEDKADRLILSWDSFMALPTWAMKKSLYPSAGGRVRAFSQIFPQIDAEFHLAIRSPATFVPLLYDRLKPESYEAFMEGTDLFALRWSVVIRRIRDANPQAPLTVWCDEDTPLIWPEVLRAVSGLPADVPLTGEDELLATLMSGEGMVRLSAYLDKHPPQNILQRRRVVSAFLDKFALPERINMNIEMPGWTDEVVAHLNALYEADVAEIAGMDGVDFMAP
ncbi:hypothetical protein [Fuscibacter oryzae]|uniref:Uncharacterized protein n=1 Tax=Fuscibacter oryzae TaxID=2803939 RepID=A0A8J7MRX7_9RHOB|nr:hypothetical protein [Fuscibacter oryzae]MBL4927278.1 hypothetical protein [Fuscibacter oryzae]